MSVLTKPTLERIADLEADLIACQSALATAERRIAALSNQDYELRQQELKRVHDKYGGVMWPKYRSDPGFPPLPETWNWTEANDAVIEALCQEGVTAWGGDATSIVTQMIGAQFNRWQAALQRAEQLTEALEAQMKWIGSPPTDPHSFDSVREDAWEKSLIALRAARNPRLSIGGQDAVGEPKEKP